MVLASLVYFLAADWEPCFRGRQSLVIILIFNLWTILPLAPGPMDPAPALGTSKAGRVPAAVSATTLAMPFWTPPPFLLQAATSARFLVRSACITLPGSLMTAKVLPEGGSHWHAVFKLVPDYTVPFHATFGLSQGYVTLHRSQCGSSWQ